MTKSGLEVDAELIMSALTSEVSFAGGFWRGVMGEYALIWTVFWESWHLDCLGDLGVWNCGSTV